MTLREELPETNKMYRMKKDSNTGHLPFRWWENKEYTFQFLKNLPPYDPYLYVVAAFNENDEEVGARLWENGWTSCPSFLEFHEICYEKEAKNIDWNSFAYKHSKIFSWDM